MRLGMGLGLGNLLSGQPLTGFPNDFSFNFDGSNDYLDCGNPTALQITGQISISCWIKTSDKSANQNIVSKDDNTNRNFLLQTMSSSGVCRLALFSGNSIIFVDTAVDVCDGNWHHILATFTPSTSLKIYLDGSLSGTNTTSVPSSIDNDDVGLNIGRKNNSDLYFDGLIDEVAVWDTALDASTIAKLGSKPVDVTKYSASNLKLWLRAGDKALPEEDASIARQDFYTDFDGIDDMVALGSDASLDNVFVGGATLTAWIKPSSDGENNLGRIFDKSDATSGTDGWHLVTLAESSGSCDLRFGHGRATTTGIWDTTNTEVNIDEWTHVAVTYNNSSTDNNASYYINGKSVAVTEFSTPSGSAVDDSSQNLFIGNNTGEDRSFAGAISSASIYKTILDAQTISQMAKSRFSPVRNSRFSVVDFDGTDVKITFTRQVFTGAFTISWWFNGDTQTFYQRMFNDSTSANNNILTKDSNGLVTIRINGTYRANISGVPHNEWCHLAFTRDGSGNIKSYLNGVASGTSSTTDEFALDFIGEQVVCSMASASMYNVEKSAEEIYAIYQQGITYDESSLSGLVGYWRMGDDTSAVYPTIADSSSNSNDGTITNGALDDIVQQMVAGYDLGAFESSSEELNGNSVLNGSFEDDGASWGNIGSPTTSEINTDLAYVRTGTKSWKIVADGDDDGIFQNVTQTAGKIYYVEAYVYIISGAVELFSNGASIATTSTTGSFQKLSGYYSFGSNITLTVRSFNTGGTFYIDDVSIQEVLQSELSDTHPAIIDVNEPVLGAELMGSDTDFTLSGTQSASTTGTYWVTGANWTISGGKAIYDDGGNTKLEVASSTFQDAGVYKFSFDISDASSGARIKLLAGSNELVASTTYQNGTNEVYFNKSSAFGSAKDLEIEGRTEAGTFKIDNVSVKKILGNVGTMTNQEPADLVYSSVLPDQSFLTGVNSAYNFLDFDGTDAYVSVSAINDNYKSISFWFNLGSNATSSTAYTTFGAIGSFQGSGSFITIGGGATSSVTNELITLGASGVITAWESDSDTITGNVWHHLAIVWNGSKYVFYYDGELKDTTSGTASHVSLQSNNSIFIGRNAGGSSYYKDNLTSYSVFNKSLSASEVSAIYTAGRHTNLLDSYNDNLLLFLAFGALDSKTGLPDTDSTIYDRSGNSNHGTTSGTATGDLKSPPNAEPNGYSKQDLNRSTTTP